MLTWNRFIQSHLHEYNVFQIPTLQQIQIHYFIQLLKSYKLGSTCMQKIWFALWKENNLFVAIIKSGRRWQKARHHRGNLNMTLHRYSSITCYLSLKAYCWEVPSIKKIKDKLGTCNPTLTFSIRDRLISELQDLI